MRIFVAGPYWNDDPAIRQSNVVSAMQYGSLLLEKGHDSFVPHLFHFWNQYNYQVEDVWKRLDIVWLKQCEAILRIGGPSKGADNEMLIAGQLGLQCFYLIDDVPTNDPCPWCGCSFVVHSEKLLSDCAEAFGLSEFKQWTKQ